MKTQFQVFTDNANGWVAVKRKMLKDLGILDKLSGQTYQRGATVYIEEDEDRIQFQKRFKERFGFRPKYVEKRYERAPVRNFEPLDVNAPIPEQKRRKRSANKLAS